MSIDRQQVIDEAMRLVDADGLDALTLRRLASRLGVQAPTLYWHVRNKAELLDALGDVIIEGAIGAIPDPKPDGDWREWLLAALIEFRRAMLAHPNGARIVSGARDSLRRADFSERAMSTLVEHGVPLQQARMTVLVAEGYTVGRVLEEQAAQRDSAQPSIDLGELERRLPTAMRAITEYFSSGRTVDDLYDDGVRLILGMPARP